MGLDRSTAGRMAVGTALGSALLAAEEGAEDVSILRERVTSKGGTTEQALRVFKERGLDLTVEAATLAALDRARELAKL